MDANVTLTLDSQEEQFRPGKHVRREPSPAIPIGWPVCVGASDRYIYVGDCLNHRIVRVDKKFAAESLIELP